MRASKAVYHPNGDANTFQTVEDTLDDILYGSTAKIGGSTGTTDNSLLRADGTGEKTLQNSAVTIDDSGNLTGVGTINTNPVFATATAAEYQGDTAGAKALTPAEVWNAAEYVALTDAASITVNMATGWNFSVTIAGNRTIANPSNAKPGQSGCFKVTASGGTRTIDVGTQYLTTLSFPISIASGNICYIFYFVDTSSRIIITAAINNPA